MSSNLQTIPHLIYQRLKETPDHIAIVNDDCQVTYRELWSQSGMVLSYIQKHWQGGDSGALVGLLMEKSDKLMISMLGVMRAGLGYVPMDVSYPHERLSYISSDCKLKGIVTTSEHMMSVDYYDGNFLVIDIEMKRNKQGVSDEMAIDSEHDQIAYVIYTSGSTGNPKGVMVEHRQICNTLLGRKEYYRLGHDTVQLQLHSASFDASVEEIFAPLVSGGKIILVNNERRNNVQAVEELIRKTMVTNLLMVPSFYHVFLEQLINPIQSIRYVVSAGEALTTQIRDLHFSKLSSAQLVNAYGPTECAVCSTNWKAELNTKVMIGSPSQGVVLSLRNDEGHEVHDNELGQIYIGGNGVARGYLNNPELTHENFLSYEHGRFYRTGDWARRVADGELEFVGRKDTLEKINGYRVELTEIEVAIRQHKNIHESVVAYREAGGSVKQLIAYYQSVDGKDIDELSDFIGDRLPHYMIPVRFVRVQNFHRTTNGKLDRSNLPEIGDQKTKTENRVAVTSAEKILVEIYQETFGLSSVSISDDFFELGGDSIKAIQLSSRMHGQGYRLEVRDIFEHSVIHAHAQTAIPFESHTNSEDVVEGTLPLTPIQKRFFTREPWLWNHYNQSVVLVSNGRFDNILINQVINRLMQHHDALRMNYTQDKIQFNQGLEIEQVHVETFELRGRSDAEQKMGEVADAIQASFVLTNGPLVKAALFRLDQEDRLLLVIHHLVVDGISWRILFEDFRSLYLSQGKGALPLKTGSFKEWAEKLNAYSHGRALMTELSYWKGIESHASAAGIESEHQQGSNFLRDKQTVSLTFPTSSTEELLRRTSSTYRMSTEELLLAALGLAIRLTWRKDRIYVMMEGHGREEMGLDIDISRIVGWFTSVYPVCVDVRNVAKLSDYLMSVKEEFRSIPHHGIGYSLLRYIGCPEELREDGDILFNYLGQFDADVSRENSDSVFHVSDVGTGRTEGDDSPQSHKLRFTAIVVGGNLIVDLAYSGNQFNRESIKLLSDHFEAALVSIIDHCRTQQPQLTPSDLSYQKISVRNLENLQF